MVPWLRVDKEHVLNAIFGVGAKAPTQGSASVGRGGTTAPPSFGCAIGKKDKTVVKFCKTVAATAPFLMPILVPLVSVTLRNSGTDTKSTKIGIKNGAVATTVLQNSATVLS